MQGRRWGVGMEGHKLNKTVIWDMLLDRSEIIFVGFFVVHSELGNELCGQTTSR